MSGIVLTGEQRVKLVKIFDLAIHATRVTSTLNVKESPEEDLGNVIDELNKAVIAAYDGPFECRDEINEMAKLLGIPVMVAAQGYPKPKVEA